MGVTLVIGDRTWSSWSMRPWLVLERSGLAFDVETVRLREGEATAAAIRAAGSPSGQVPVLKTRDGVVWGSLAICEHVAEIAPDAALWPRDPWTRAIARAAAGEMHAGFAALRAECPMDLARPPEPTVLSPAARRDVERLTTLFGALRREHAAGGPFLFGGWSIADAFFTPVATRFRTYAVNLSDYGDEGAAGLYVDALLSTPAFKAWEADARAER